MPVNVYECMLILDSNRYGSKPAAVIEQIHSLFEKHQAEILVSRPWDERRLAYPIKGHKKGTYYLIYFKSEGKALRPIEQDFALNDAILRSLILRIHPKLVDAMLAVAREEPAAAEGEETEAEPSAGEPAETSTETAETS